MQYINICGIPYEIEEVEPCEAFNSGGGKVLGFINYSEQVIQIRKGLPDHIKEETILHEMVHGILFHTGRNDLVDNEEFVQHMANALLNSSISTQIMAK